MSTKKKTASKGGKTKPAAANEATKQKEDLVVFAFRLKAEERALIHKAAGPAKASKFIRTLAVAASKGDAKAVSEIVAAVKA